MSGAKHTLGPWLADGRVVLRQSEHGAVMVADFGKGGDEFACLAAQAPEMTVLLQEVSAWNLDRADLPPDLARRIESAIAKATGSAA